MPYERDYEGVIEEERHSPAIAAAATQRCADCAHWERCSDLICSLTGSETRCDWIPSRFEARV